MRFDFLGIFILSEAVGIEHLVEPIGDGRFLSRTAAYYGQKTETEAAIEREECNSLLPLIGKKAFVVAERMLNCSCRVYCNCFAETAGRDSHRLSSARRCLEDDTARVLMVLEGQVADRSDYYLPEGETLTESRMIEGDHKQILCEAIASFPQISHVVCPLYGAVLIGPIFKCLRGISYTHVMFGIHDQQSSHQVKNGMILDIHKSVDIDALPESLAIVDSNIGTGLTTAILKATLAKMGKTVQIGSIELSWEYYDQVKRKLRDATVFDVGSIDFPTYLNYRHHSVAKSLLAALRCGGSAYLRKLKEFGLKNAFVSDFELMFNRGKTIADHYGLRLNSYLQQSSNFILSMDIMDRKIRYLERLPVNEAIKIVRDFNKVNVIDIDAYQGNEPNFHIMRQILAIKSCRVGGGIRTREHIEKLLKMGAEKVIVGSHADEKLLDGFPPERIIVALDSIDRKTGLRRDIPSLIKRFEPYCSELQYVSVEDDGKASGGDLKNAIKYAKLTSHPFVCVGGIASLNEVMELKQHNIFCAVGRAAQEGYFGDST